MYHTMDDLAYYLHVYTRHTVAFINVLNASFLNFVFSSTAVSTPSQSALRGSEAVSE